MVRRGAYYLLLSGTVGVLYVGAVVGLNVVLQAGEVAGSAAFPVLFTLAVLLLLNPLRTRLQAVVDRLFGRTRYETARVLDALGAELAATLQQDRIATLVRDTIGRAVPNDGTRLFVRTPETGEGFREVGGDGDLPPALMRRLAEGTVVRSGERSAAGAALAALGAVLAVPLEAHDELGGVLAVGAKRTGLPWGRRDVELLRAIASQAAVALENARSYEALVAAGARLEARVRARTAQLEATHRELMAAYAELESAESQLVHSEKMASLGRLVAGVAHEINNPVSFIATSIEPLRRRLVEARSAAPPEALALLGEAEEIADVMARGAARTAAIVRDLRSFSRLGEAERTPADLHQALEVSLRLLESRWRDRVTVHRDFGALPAIVCDPGQLTQVFMNVLANASDATTAGGNVWVTTRARAGEVEITVRDDGVGMTAEVRDHVFDPFFTTKDVGAGTGLGLAISHGVVDAHGGRLAVESAPGRGTTFRIVLPVAPPDVALDTASSGRR